VTSIDLKYVAQLSGRDLINKVRHRSGVHMAAAMLLSLLFTYVFFIEYLPPIRRVHIPYDLQGFHYPLNDYAFRAFRQGRFPEWDPTIFCGMNFTGNIQTALFYPPSWLLYLANYGRARLTYLSLEIFVLAHAWLAFLLCYLWLLEKNLLPLACILGAGIFAYSGYMLLQLQHLGLVCTYAWVPLGFWGIDESITKGAWQPLWKLVIGSAFGFLAGYPPTWVVFAVCMLAYSTFRYPFAWRPIIGTALALALSLFVCMAQLLPALESTGLKQMLPRYGAGIRNLDFYISYVIPNYFNFGLKTPVETNPGCEYLYLGGAAFFGLFWSVRRNNLRDSLPLLGVAGVTLVAVTNPFGIVWAVIKHSLLLADLCRCWYFLAGVTIAIAPLAAMGIDRFLNKKPRHTWSWLKPVTVTAIIIWSFAQIFMWRPSGPGVPFGWRSGVLLLVTLALFSTAMLLFRSEQGRWKPVLAVALLLAAGVDYKVFGTSSRVNAQPGNVDRLYLPSGSFPGMSDQNYQQLKEDKEYRIVSDLNFSLPIELRHFGLTSPQGMDPLLPRPYKKVVGSKPQEFLIDIDAPHDKDLLKLLAVRYVLSSQAGPKYTQLLSDSGFRLLPAHGAHFKVFEFLNAQPPYRWDRDAPGNTIRRVDWKPKRREFFVHSSQAGRFILVEESFPGWEAWVDGHRCEITPWYEAFQSIWVPAGDHQVLFRFRSRSLRWGATLTVIGIIVTGLLYRPRHRENHAF
jgi:hypothetical protein